ncbi:MAG: beta-Ala-His dipeptidase [Acidobacteriota bacterium]
MTSSIGTQGPETPDLETPDFETLDFEAPASDDSPLLALEPGFAWRFFDGIRRIPRPSKQEGRIAAAVEAWAAKRAFECAADAAGNLVIRVPASAGHESAPAVVLQAHLDMVCEKNAGVEHDFERDPIAVKVDGDWVKAVGTTLGADNGMGVALAMAAAVDPEVEHGPLELLFTLDEETGLNGAQALDGSLVQGRLMINLDAEEDTTIYIGCAGAAGVVARLPVQRVMARGGRRFTLALRGLVGGHSGVEINTGRGNAVKLLARALVLALDSGLDFRLIHIRGGDKPNAIPREAFAELYLDPDEEQDWRQLLGELTSTLQEQLGGADPGVSFSLETDDGPPRSLPLDPRSTFSTLRLLDALPHGVVAMSQSLPGLVETSVNLARAASQESHLELMLSLRSSSDPALDGLGQSLASLCRVAGAEVDRLAGYSGWAPEPESELVALTASVYEDLFDDKPLLEAVHAGVECGVVAKRVPGLKAVSIGPDILGAHSPDERVSVPSVAKTYRWLKQLLATLTGGDLGARPAD